MRFAVVIECAWIVKNERKRERLVLNLGVEKWVRIAKGAFGDTVAVGLPNPHHGITDLNVNSIGSEDGVAIGPDVYGERRRRD
jgi:hypothetical protein